jgi:hypothetical protein
MGATIGGAAMWIMSTPEALMFTALVLAFVALAQR